MHCFVYKSPKRDLLYLFVPSENDFGAVPEVLMKSFGEPAPVMELELEPGRPMARGNADEVIRNIEHQGFHLQMPPEDPWV